MSRLRLMCGREVRALVSSPVIWLSICLAWFLTGLTFRYAFLEWSGGHLSGMLLLVSMSASSP